MFSIDDKQFGKKIGKHAHEYGLDEKVAEDRNHMRSFINDIVSNPDEVCVGDWRGQDGPVVFFIKVDDVVVTTQKGEFISILKGGVNNARVKKARKRRI